MLPNTDQLRDNCEKIQWFGLGFIQLKMKNPSERYHFYTDMFEKTADEEDIHTHRKNFQSSILKGQLSQYIYRMTPWLDANRSSPYVHSFVDCGEELSDKVTIWPTGVDIACVHSSYYNAGSQYDIDSSVLHRVESTNAITYLQLGPKTSSYAEVIRRRGVPEICPLSVVVPENQLWTAVDVLLVA